MFVIIHKTNKNKNLLTNSFCNIKAFYFFLDDTLAFFKHFNLCIKLVHLVFVFKDHILIDISDLELEVFRAHREREVVFIQELAVEHAICWIQFG